MTRLEQLILFILDRAKKMGIDNLSKLQLFKIPYLIQVLSIKYAGTQFIPEITFIRDKMGPISIAIYAAIENLEKMGYVGKEIKKDKGNRHCHRLVKNLPKLNFSVGEEIFLDNFLHKLLPLTQPDLKKFAYSTEPMKKIQKEESSGSIKKGAVIDFSGVTVDPDVVDSYSDSI